MKARGTMTAAREGLRARLWPLPSAAVVVAVALGTALPRVDRRIDPHLSTWIADYVFDGDAGAARTLLGAVASSLITVTSLTFSLTVVTLQLASSQFSPRLLRTFTRDLFVQVTLGLFLMTFAFALTVMRSVRTGDGAGQPTFVPRVSVTFAFLLALASVLCLVLFLAHLARHIRVEAMLRAVHDEATATARRVLEGRTRRSAPHDVPVPPTDCVGLLAPRSGFLVGVDMDALSRAAADAQVVVLIDAVPGGSVVAGTPYAFAWRPARFAVGRRGRRTCTQGRRASGVPRIRAHRG